MKTSKSAHPREIVLSEQDFDALSRDLLSDEVEDPPACMLEAAKRTWQELLLAQREVAMEQANQTVLWACETGCLALGAMFLRRWEVLINEIHRDLMTLRVTSHEK